MSLIFTALPLGLVYYNKTFHHIHKCLLIDITTQKLLTNRGTSVKLESKYESKDLSTKWIMIKYDHDCWIFQNLSNKLYLSFDKLSNRLVTVGNITNALLFSQNKNNLLLFCILNGQPFDISKNNDDSLTLDSSNVLKITSVYTI